MPSKEILMNIIKNIFPILLYNIGNKLLFTLLQHLYIVPPIGKL